MTVFVFGTDEEGETFCLAIAENMMKLFGVSRKEAIGRINEFWKHEDSIFHDDIVFHEDEEDWANTIFYGHDSYWWLNPPDLRPQPYHGEK